MKTPCSPAKKKKKYICMAELNLLVMHSVGRCFSLSNIPGESGLKSPLIPLHCTNESSLQDNPQQAEALPESCVYIVRVLKVEKHNPVSMEHNKYILTFSCC